MDTNFWFQRWKENRIAFHKSEVNPALAKHFKALSLVKGNRIFVPLCGKTLDIAWLLSHGYRVAGAEWIEMAIEQLFLELEVAPDISETKSMKCYTAKDIDIFVGNIFDVSSEMLGPVDAVYDRAALVALPKEMRNRYTKHLVTITDQAPQLLLTYDYDQTLMEGPPFSIGSDEVNQHYRESYDISLVESNAVPGGLKGKCEAQEKIWLLR